MSEFDFRALPIPAAFLDSRLIVRGYQPGLAPSGPALAAGRHVAEGLSAAQASALSAAGAVARHLGVFRGALTLPATGGGLGDWDCLWFPAETGSIALFLGRAAAEVGPHRASRSDRQLHEAWREAALDAFAGACAHELAQPLAAAEASAAALELLDPRAAASDALRQLRAAVARAGGLLKTLRRRAEMPVAANASVDAAAEVRSALRQLDDPEEVRFAAPPDLPPVAAGEHVVELIALNLVRHALAAVEKVAKPDVQVELALRDGFLELSVADNGPGVPPEEHRNMFVPFGERGAAALGLALARRLAELHGGALRLRPRDPGRGAAFVAVLPLAPLARAAGVP